MAWHGTLIVVLSALAGAPVLAQHGRIEGSVQDAETGLPLPGANVVLAEAGLGAASDASGEFRIEFVPAGTHRVWASYAGFEPQQQSVAVGAGETVRVTFRLVPVVLEGIEVVADRLRTVGRTRALPHLMPQSVSVVDEAQFRAQGSLDLEDALRNVSGVALAAREQPFGTFTLRGFGSDFTGTFRRNGIEFPHLYDALRANVTQVEVLKGPASVLYGRIEPGGVVNLVTRLPQCAQPARELEAAGDPFASGFLRGTWTLPCPAGGPEAVVDVSAEHRGSHRGAMVQQAAFASAAVRQRFGDRTELVIDAEHERAGADLDPGIPLPGGTVPAVFSRRAYFGEPEAGYTWRSSFASATLGHHQARGPLGRLTARVAYGAYHHGREVVKLDSLTADGLLARSLTSDETHYRYLFGEASADGAFRTGPLSHAFVLGVEATRLAVDVTGEAPLRHVEGGFRFAAIDPIALDEPRPTGLPGPGELVQYVWVRGAGINFGVFGHNQVTITTPLGPLHAVGAVRLAHVTAAAEWFALAATPDTPAGLNEREASLTAVTPSGGLLLEPAPGWSVYASYGTSFNPVFQQVDEDGQPFEPTRGEQFEVGLKRTSSRLTFSLAAYDLRKRGALSVAPTGFYVQTGEQRSRGLEAEVSALPLPGTRLLGSVTLLEAIVTADEVIPVGNSLPGAPTHAGRLWGSYEVWGDGTRGISLALGLQHVGPRYGTLDNRLRLPAHQLIDAALTADLTQQVRLQLQVENLLDEHYLVNAYRRGDAAASPALAVGWPGAPRTVRLRLLATL